MVHSSGLLVGSVLLGLPVSAVVAVVGAEQMDPWGGAEAGRHSKLSKDRINLNEGTQPTSYEGSLMSCAVTVCKRGPMGLLKGLSRIGRQGRGGTHHMCW